METKITEFFNFSTSTQQDWKNIVDSQHCGYLQKKCLKNRKSQADIAIGTCTVNYGTSNQNIIICPHRLLEKRKIFIDCIHLLTLHQPGNELHIVSEINLPGGSVDYFLVSTQKNKVKDFVGIELQTLDTTGTVWPERQRFLQSKNISVNDLDSNSTKPFGMNWKMTAKTILVQLHHKIDTFEHLSKHLVLVVQDCMLDYMKKEFSFDHIVPSRIGDSMQFHSYSLEQSDNKLYTINLSNRLSTDSNGISKCLGLQAQANIELEHIVKLIESKINDKTLFQL